MGSEGILGWLNGYCRIIISFHLRLVVTNSFLTGIDPEANYRFYSSVMTACMYSFSMYALHVYVAALVV